MHNEKCQKGLLDALSDSRLETTFDPIDRRRTHTIHCLVGHEETVFLRYDGQASKDLYVL